jgi:hypothetical protein
VQCLFNYIRKEGWTTGDMEHGRNLFQHWRVISENISGLNGRPVKHVARVGDILDDVKRFGTWKEFISTLASNLEIHFRPEWKAREACCKSWAHFR